jgi:hypothetical protein
MDMPYSGTLTTILSDIEPAIAIFLACIPLMQPIFKKLTSRVDNTRSGYNTGEFRRGYTKQKGGSREPSRYSTDLFEDDDNDDDSQIQLQPIGVSEVGILTMSHDIEGLAMPYCKDTITTLA